MSEQPLRPYWSSMTSYLLVTTGAVVGLGNIIRFPFYVFKFGGMFVLFYIFCELFICLPLFFSELLIGRRGKQNPVGSFSILAMESGASRKWRFLGWLCFIILVLSLASYTVSVAFPAVYFVDIFTIIGNNVFNSAPSSNFLSLPNNTLAIEIGLLIFLFITMLVILRGINRGLETISCITVPLYFIILLGLAIYSCSVGNVMLALHHLFDFTPDDSIATVFFAALAYAFFKLNIGMGSMIVYGSYLPYSVPLARSTLIIILLDAIVSLLAYFVVCPLFDPRTAITGVLSYQETLYYFLQANSGYIIALFFFLSIIIAAWTPVIAMAESATVILIERFDLSRRVATYLIFSAAVVIGTIIVLAYQAWGNVLIFHQWRITRIIDGLTATILIPISAFFTAVFAGWILKRNITENELGFNSKIYSVWRFLVRWVAPVFILMTVVILWGLPD